jgi:hypothetical protein
MDEQLKQIQKLLDAADGNLASARNLIRELTGQNIAPLNIDQKLENLNISDEGKVIEGIFDGEAMTAADGQTYPVPPNYASKSKLVEGDTLKLTIANDGSFIFKQIAPVERRNAIGTLAATEGGYTISAEGKSYKVLTASVTFYKAEPGDQVTIILPKEHDANWAVLENVIKKASQEVAVNAEAEPGIVIPEPPMSNGDPEPIVPVNEPIAAPTEKPETVIPVPETPVDESVASIPLSTAIPTEDNNAIPDLPESQNDTNTELPTIDPAQTVPTTPEPQIEFPGGNTPLSDDELLQNLKENLKTLEQPQYTAPEVTISAEPKPVDNIVANDLDRIENTPRDDKQIAELDI